MHLHCTTSGPVPLPATLPQVVARIGIDLNPLDITDPDDLAWLRALVWQGPVEGERLQRLDAAAAVAAQEPPVLLTGDLVERLREPAEALRQREALRHKADMEYAHQLAAQDPKLVAMLIQHWMNANDQ